MGSEKYTIAYAKTIIQWRWVVLIGTLVLGFFIASGGQHLGQSTNYRAFFGKENPQLKAFEEIENVYTKTDNILYVVKPKSGDVFTPRVLSCIQEMTEKAWKLPYAKRVDSLTNFQHTYAEGDDLTVVDLVDGDPAALSKEKLDQIRKVALSEPLLVNRAVNGDGTATGILITVTLPRESETEVPETVAASDKLRIEVQAKYPDIEIRPTGIVYMNNAFVAASMRDLQTLVPIMFLVLTLMMFFILKSTWASLSTLGVITLSAACAMGFGGWLGVELTPPSSMVPVVVLTLAIADSIHIIITMQKAMGHGMKKLEALVESMRVNFSPVFLTSFTTVIGFLSLNFSDAPPFHDLGNMAAFGIGAAFFFSVTFLPALLSILPMTAGNVGHAKATRLMDRFGEFVIAQRTKLLWGINLLALFLSLMCLRLEINDMFIQYLDESMKFRQDSEFAMDNLTGIYTIEYSIPAENPEGVSDPEYLNTVEKLSNFLKAQPEVYHVYSITDIVKRLNKNLHGDNETFYRIPENKELAAQYLLLYEFSLPYGLDLNDRINIDKSKTRMTVTVHDLTTKEVKAFDKRVVQWLKENGKPYMQTEAASPIIMFTHISERNVTSMLKGNAVSLILISISIMIMLGSVTIGLFSLLPNILPVLMGYGLWAVLAGRINLAAAIASAVALGIIVDDTIHFLSKYLRARREKGLSKEDGVRYAFDTVGEAMAVTTVILVFGFSVLAFSTFQVNVFLGILTVLIIICALVADFLLLPPLLMKLDRETYK